ncbi:unnamed protein product [Mortierella alpina]
MIFSRTMLALCFAAVTLAQGCSSQTRMEEGLSADPHAEMMEGLRCKCESTFMNADYTFTEAACGKLGKRMRYCWNQAQDYCETGDRGYDFRYVCALRGPDCWTEAC